MIREDYDVVVVDDDAPGPPSCPGPPAALPFPELLKLKDVLSPV